MHSPLFLSKCRLLIPLNAGPDGIVATMCGPTGSTLRIIASWGGDWDHVSVSLADRCPTWDEMAFVKEVFFRPDEAVMQLHPPRSVYKNLHPFCLHLWRPQHEPIPLPPPRFV